MKSIRFITTIFTVLLAGCLADGKNTKQSDNETTEQMIELTNTQWVSECMESGESFILKQIAFNEEYFTSKTLIFEDSRCDTVPVDKKFETGSYSVDGTKKNLEDEYILNLSRADGENFIEAFRMKNDLLYFSSTSQQNYEEESDSIGSIDYFYSFRKVGVDPVSKFDC